MKHGTQRLALITFGVTEPLRFGSEGDMAHLLVAVIRASGLTTVGDPRVQRYPAPSRGMPKGLTILQCLGESHASLETYPEHGLVEVMISSCKHFSMAGISAFLEPYEGWAKLVDFAYVLRGEAGRWNIKEEVADEARVPSRS